MIFPPAFGVWVSLIYGYHLWSGQRLLFLNCMTPHADCWEPAEPPNFRSVQLLGHLRVPNPGFKNDWDMTG
jgi:hypothetical protein